MPTSGGVMAQCVKQFLIGAVGLVLIASAESWGQSAVQYEYDAAGRLSQVTSPSGNTTQYSYDAAGNITSIVTNITTLLDVVGVYPESGLPGDTVTLVGNGFNTTLASNTVKFNGVQATVLSATASQLTVTVPALATTGTITATVGSTTATSAQVFQVSPKLAEPTITSFSPTIASPGALVTILGTHFSTTPLANRALFNSTFGTIGAATATTLAVPLPANTGSGPISVTTPGGVSFSSNDFFTVPTNPAGVTVSNIAVTGRTTVNATSPYQVSLAPGQVAMVLFNGVRGQNIGLGLSPTTLSVNGSANVYLKSPQGIDLMAPYNFRGNDNVELPTLPATGSYTLLVVPASGSSLSTGLLLSQDLTGTLIPNGPATVFTSTRPGQAATYYFNGIQGANGTLVFSSNTLTTTAAYNPCSSVQVFSPAGVRINWTGFNNGYTGYQCTTSPGLLVLQNLPMTGLYSVKLLPVTASTGSLALNLTTDFTGTIVPDGPAISGTLADGQFADINFNGTMGQNLSLGLSTSAGTQVALLGPDTSSYILWNSTTCYPPGCQLPTLPVNGTYLIRLATYLADGAFPNAVGTPSQNNVTMQLSSAATASLTPNAPPVTFNNSTRLQQNGNYTFNAAAGQSYTLMWTGSTLFGAIDVFDPNGVHIAANAINNNQSANGILSLPAPLQATGAYSVIITPAPYSVGAVGISLVQDATGVVQTNGNPTSIALSAGQNADYTFAGTAGQVFSIAVTGFTANGGNSAKNLYITDPNGNAFVDSLTSNPQLNAPQPLPQPGLNGLLPPLQISGTYTVHIVPYTPSGTQHDSATAMGAASLNVSLLAISTTSLSSSGVSSAFAASSFGQTGVFTFQAAAGQNVTLNWTGSTFQNSGTQIVVTSPASPSIVANSTAPPFTLNVESSLQLLSPVQVNSAFLGKTAVSGKLLLNNLPATGQYTVYVLPTSTDVGSIQLAYTLTGSTPTSNGPYQGTLSIDGSPLVTSIPANTTYNYSFSGSQGQSVVFIQNNLTAQDNASIRGPSGAALLTTSGAVLGQQFNPPYTSAFPGTLPATGTYEIQIETGNTPITASLQLVSSVVQVLTPNGTDLTLANPPQGGGRQLLFNATAGQSGSLSWQTYSCPGNSFSYTLRSPSGRVVINGTTGAYQGSEGALPFNYLPESGVYVFTGGCIGSADSISIGLRINAIATLAVNGAFIPVSLLDGQSGYYLFAGTAGQAINVGTTVGGSVASPASPYVCLYDPDGRTMAGAGLAGQNNCQPVSLSGGGGNLLPTLPSNGTYGLYVASPKGPTSFNLGLSTPVTGVITPGAPATPLTIARAGQWAFLSMPGTGIGTDETLVITNSTFGGATLNVYAPEANGTPWATMSFGAGNQALKLPGQVGTGMYSVAIGPSSGATGLLNIQAVPDLQPVLSSTGAPLNLSLALGQNANVAFSATAGQNVSIGWSNLSASNSVDPLIFDVFQPTGGLFYRLLGNSSPYGRISSFGYIDLGQVPETGTYILRISNGYGQFTPQTVSVTLQQY